MGLGWGFVFFFEVDYIHTMASSINLLYAVRDARDLFNSILKVKLYREGKGQLNVLQILPSSMLLC